MSDSTALLWALESTFGAQCVQAEHGLTFAGDGFTVFIHPEGRLTLYPAAGSASPAQGWLLSALAEFLAPAGAQRSVQGVSVPVGSNVVHFGADGYVRLERAYALGREEDTRPAPAPAADRASSGRPAVAMTRGPRGKRALIFQEEAYDRRHAHQSEALAAKAGRAEAEQARAAEVPAMTIDDLASAADTLWQRWKGRAAEAPGVRAAQAEEDRTAVRDLLNVARRQGALRSPGGKELLRNLVALDGVLRLEATGRAPDTSRQEYPVDATHQAG